MTQLKTVEIDEAGSDLDLTAELITIGCLMAKPHLLSQITLKADDFLSESNGVVYGAILRLAGERKPIDPFTVADELGDKSLVPELARMSKEAYQFGAIEEYAEAIRKAKKGRTAMEIGFRLIENQDVSEAQSSLIALGTSRVDTSSTIASILPDVIANMDSDAARGATTGLVDLDRLIGGLHDSDLIVVGARTRMGKTAFMLNLANNCGRTCGIFSTEQPKEQIAQRLICIDGKVSAERMRLGKLQPDEYEKITRASARLIKKNMHIDDRGFLKIDDVIATARRWKYQHDIGAIYLDYIQRMQGTDRRAPRHYQIDEIVNGLKSLAKELGIPVIALAQVNRDVEKEVNKRPTLASLKDSGSIEQEADLILTLYRDEVYDENTQDKGIAEICALKNRHGRTGGMRARWLGEYMRFDNLSYKTEADSYGAASQGW